ncbi:MAG: response regulator transcription factor [Verrucomicrobia bacterium]|nr:response regulator transcription factor [Deltaproteobacteria bacterium]
MRLIIVEDNRLILENLRLLLSGETGITVDGAFACAEDALQELTDLKPEIMLVDLDLPGISGIELIRQVKGRTPEVEMMAYTIFEDRETVFAAIKAGACGYILKGSSPRELIESLNSLYQGGAPMSPKIARKVIREFHEDDEDSEKALLSHKEKNIVRCVEQGLTYKEIAERFYISPHTVHTHIKNIYEKLHAKDRREAIKTARKKGLI